MLTRVRRALPGAERLGNAMAIDPAQTSVLAAVSNAMVRLHKEQFGRGPTRARSEWAGPDQLVVTLEDTLTPPDPRRARPGGPRGAPAVARHADALPVRIPARDHRGRRGAHRPQGARLCLR